MEMVSKGNGLDLDRTTRYASEDGFQKARMDHNMDRKSDDHGTTQRISSGCGSGYIVPHVRFYMDQ